MTAALERANPGASRPAGISSGAGLVDYKHLAIVPILLGWGERLLDVAKLADR
jgi:hypothetical protein